MYSSPSKSYPLSHHNHTKKEIPGSWSNQIAPWQWYIHGDGETSEYLALSSDYKNPAASDAQGLRTRLVLPPPPSQYLLPLY